MINVQLPAVLEEWQSAARALLLSGTSPVDVRWIDQQVAQQDMFSSERPLHPETLADLLSPATEQPARVPRRFAELAKFVAVHRDPERWKLLYSVLWRLEHENRNLLKVETDDEVSELLRLEKQVRRDVHKMHAFVRFRKVSGDEEQFVAWYRPDHSIAELVAPFFKERFASMLWSIVTPDRSIHWNGKELSFAEGAGREVAPTEDKLEALWRTYYASIFNPARTNLRAMRSELPVRFWRDLPESAEIASLISRAKDRVAEMVTTQEQADDATPFLPTTRTLDALESAAAACRGCDLYRDATQTVFGKGPVNARLVFVGEQPGDHEDRSGEPFIGPAGAVFDDALLQAGINRAEVYVTNAVKHFKHEVRGKQRIHKTPRLSEVVACRPWVDAELQAIAPQLVVCLGATASRALLGARYQLMKERGALTELPNGTPALATVHPSAILRASTPESSAELFGFLVRDLQTAAKTLEAGRRLPPNGE